MFAALLLLLFYYASGVPKMGLYYKKEKEGWTEVYNFMWVLKIFSKINFFKYIFMRATFLFDYTLSWVS